MPSGAPPVPQRQSPRSRVARQALALCAHADGLAREVQDALDGDDNRIAPLLVQRDQVLQQLAAHVAYLRKTRPAADHPAHAAAEQALEQADAVLATVLAAVDDSTQVTHRLAARVAARVEALRTELDAMQRSAASAPRYGTLGLERGGAPPVPSADRPRPINRQG